MIYISGSISNGENCSRATINENIARFNETEAMLVAKGYKVFNPAVLEQVGWTWEQYLARDLFFISENRRELTMYMMWNWKLSKGARLEHEFARLLGLLILYEGLL